MDSLKNFLKTEFSSLDAREVLQSPPKILLGINTAIQEQLQHLDIHTVFDLALSNVFANANKLLKSNQDVTDPLARYGVAPADYVDNAVLADDVSDLAIKNISILQGIAPEKAAQISTTLDVTTVRDLALWPPYQAARKIFESVFNPEKAVEYDSEAPPDLLPKTGVYPTEKVFYKTIVLDEVEADLDQLQPLESAEPIDITPSNSSDFGFKKPGVGAILTYAQQWFTQGVSLGQLLHSVALAPGESTKIAMIDWSRRTSTSVTESISETEALSNTMAHNRSISEVTHAVAKEAQQGFSRTSTESFAVEGGIAAGGIIGGILGGASIGTAYNTASAESFSSSYGRRELSASMAQNIMDSTQQHANSARNRRASIVKEVSQSESEKVSSRVVTNYNHMHALSIQYYEVVQLYRVVVQLAEIEKCLFIPMKLVNFYDPATIKRFRHILASVALNRRIQRALSSDPDFVFLSAPAMRANSGWSSGGSTGGWGWNTYRPSNQSLQANAIPNEPNDGGGGGGGSNPPSGGTHDASPVTPPPGIPSYTGSWNIRQLDQISRLTGIEVLQQNGSLKFPGEVEVLGIDYRSGVKMSKFELEFSSSDRFSKEFPANGDEVLFEEPFTLSDLANLKITNETKPSTDLHATIILRIRVKDTILFLDIPFFVPQNPTTTTVLTLTSNSITDDLKDHLSANRLHYSQAIWRSLDAATIALLLSPYKYKNKPVTQIIDPVPVTIAGNYLVFRMHADPVADIDWAKWLIDHGIDRANVIEELIPLPSGGVFAEAVLGRYNSAEKLDITRFWNWQDSPIPEKAPEIAPIQTTSRSTPDDTKPGQLSAPVVTIQSAPNVPDPTGMAAVLQAIQNGNMFRDMSGLATTIGLAQAALNNASTGAGRAANQAGANMAKAADFNLEMMKTLLPLIAGAMGVPVVPTDGKSDTPTTKGALINEGRKLDSTKQSAPSSGGTTGLGGSGSGSGGSSSGGTSSGTTGGNNLFKYPSQVIPASYAEQAFQDSLNNGNYLPQLLAQLLPTLLRNSLPATDASLYLTDSVGQGGKNDPDDVLAVQRRLNELGFDWIDMDSKMGAQTINAIKLFQSIIKGNYTITGNGLIKVGDTTHQWLEATNAPNWGLLPVGSAQEGFFNIERVEQTNDHHDYGTDWLAETIKSAGATYKTDYLDPRATNPIKPALITINDASLPTGGTTPEHEGHQTGLGCDIRLPKKDGTSPAGVTWNKANTNNVNPDYDRDTMRAILQAFKSQPLWKATYFNDPVLIAEGLCAALSAHDNHAHIDIKPPQRDGMGTITL